jgi:hypothetical protein
MSITKKCKEFSYRTAYKYAGKWYLIVAFDESWFEVTGPFSDKENSVIVLTSTLGYVTLKL